MSTLSNQFMQGSQFVRQNELDAQNQVLRKEQSQRLEEQHNLQQETGTLRNQMTAAQHKEWEGNAGRRATLAEIQVSEAQKEVEDRDHTRSRRGVIEGREDETYKDNKTRTKTIQGREDEQYQRTQNLQWLQSHSEQELYGLSTNGYLSPEYVQRMKGTAFDISQVIEPEYAQQLDFLAASLDPRDSRATPKDPRFIHSMNTVFAADINKGLAQSVHPETGSPATSKRIVNAVPVEGRPGDFYVELEVTYEDGQTRTEPMTQGRNSAPDAELGVVNAGELVQQVSARQTYKNMIEKSGLADKYKAFAAHQAKKKRDANGDKNYDQLTNWKGQTVKTSELADQYKMLPEVYREGDPEMGTLPYVSFNDYLWSQGDPTKLGVLDDVAKHNMRVDEYNRNIDDPNKHKLRVDVSQAWAAIQEDNPPPGQSSKNGGGANQVTDPNASTLDKILTESDPVDINNPQPIEDDSLPGKPETPAPQPTRRIRTPMGAMRSAYDRQEPEEEKEPVPVGQQLKSRRESRSQR
jgi:hypothetical protein